MVAISIAWNCNLDRDFMTYCLPHYTFRILDDFGWNFRHAKYHEEHRRSLYKMYGIKVTIFHIFLECHFESNILDIFFLVYRQC